MKLGLTIGTLFLSLAMALSLCESASAYPVIDEVRTDHAAHFGVSAAAQTGCSAFGRAVSGSKWGSGLTCFLMINTAGVVKEALDPYSSGHQRDVNDIYANLAGSGLSFVTISLAF